jgi:hypothetical protein
MMTFIVLAFLVVVASWIVYGLVKQARKKKEDEFWSSAPPPMENYTPVVPPSDFAAVEPPSVKTEDSTIVDQQPLDYEVALPKKPRAKKTAAQKGRSAGAAKK